MSPSSHLGYAGVKFYENYIVIVYNVVNVYNVADFKLINYRAGNSNLTVNKVADNVRQ